MVPNGLRASFSPALLSPSHISPLLLWPVPAAPALMWLPVDVALTSPRDSRLDTAGGDVGSRGIRRGGHGRERLRPALLHISSTVRALRGPKGTLHVIQPCQIETVTRLQRRRPLTEDAFRCGFTVLSDAAAGSGGAAWRLALAWRLPLVRRLALAWGLARSPAREQASALPSDGVRSRRLLRPPFEGKGAAVWSAKGTSRHSALPD